MTPEREEKLTRIFRTLFNERDLVLRDDLSAKDVAMWDSLNHITLVLTIETEFGVRFTNEEVADLQDVGELKALIDTKLTPSSP